MSEFRIWYGALFTSRRVRVSATISVSMVVDSPKPAPRCGGERQRAPEVDDRPETRARWRVLPKSIRPEDWIIEAGVDHVPGSLLITEEWRPPEYC